MNTALIPITDMQRMAEAIAKSGLFGMKRTEEALALMIVAQAENRHPGSVAAEYHIIQGRPALKADAMLARFQNAGGKVAWDAYTDTAVSAVFTHEAGGSVKIEWTMERAKKAGLTGKDNWTKYPRQMLRARVISEGVRTCYPAVCVGVYTPEEVGDFEPEKGKRRQAKDMGNAEVVDDDGVITNAGDAATPAIHSGNGSGASASVADLPKDKLEASFDSEITVDPYDHALTLYDAAKSDKEVKSADEYVKVVKGNLDESRLTSLRSKRKEAIERVSAI